VLGELPWRSARARRRRPASTPPVWVTYAASRNRQRDATLQAWCVLCAAHACVSGGSPTPGPPGGCANTRGDFLRGRGWPTRKLLPRRSTTRRRPAEVPAQPSNKGPQKIAACCEPFTRWHPKFSGLACCSGGAEMATSPASPQALAAAQAKKRGRPAGSSQPSKCRACSRNRKECGEGCVTWPGHTLARSPLLQPDAEPTPPPQGAMPSACTVCSCDARCRIIPPPVPRRRSIVSSRPRGAGGYFAFGRPAWACCGGVATMT